MTLGELIAALEKLDPKLSVRLGFHNPHSYRGYYDELAFEPAENVTIGSMLKAAKRGLVETFQGWKGGDYTYSDYTPCWLATEGTTGETLGPHFLGLLLRDAK